MKTAKALGIEVPNSMQLLADEVIEFSAARRRGRSRRARSRSSGCA
jgi:hypothetical protein